MVKFAPTFEEVIVLQVGRYLFSMLSSAKPLTGSKLKNFIC